MPKYEKLPTFFLTSEEATLCTDILPEIIHLDDPALAVMSDLSHTPCYTINESKSIDEALHSMKTHSIHLLFVTNKANKPIGIISSEDLLGEKPIKILQERRIPRAKILVSMLMNKIETTPALDIETVSCFRVGNIVKTLKENNTHYLLVTKDSSSEQKLIRGIFITSKISQQLHKQLDEPKFSN